MSKPVSAPRTSHTTLESHNNLNALMVRIRELAERGWQFAVVNRGNYWELSYVEVLA